MKRVLILAVLVSGCAAHDPPPRFASLRLEAKTPCEVMANPSAYARRRVMMKGIYFAEPHQRVLYDPNCHGWDFSVSESFTANNDRAAERLVDWARRKNPTVDIPVVYVGTFTVTPFLIGCSDVDCFHYSLEESQLLAAFPR